MAQTLAEMMAARGLTPREATFGAPWEARAFALATALADRGVFAWDVFRDRLIAAIADAEQAAAAGHPAPGYYECWLAALEDALRNCALVDSAEIARRAAELAAHPPEPTKALTTGPIKIA